MSFGEGGRMADGKVLEFSGVTKVFGDVAAVSGLTARIEPGVVTAVLGPNGAGKTTTLRILLGDIRPSSGSATIGGTPYSGLRQPARTIGAVLESPTFRPRRTATRQLSSVAKANGIPADRVREVLDLVGLTDVADMRIGGYSLGMRQRLSVAQALLGDPDVLVFDEPVNGMDPEGIRWMRLLIRRLADEGRTVLMSSHLLSEVQQVADKILIVSNGNLVFSGGIEELAGADGPVVAVDSPDRAMLARLLREHGYEFEVLRSGVNVRNATARALGQMAADGGIALSVLHQRGPSLEDVFLDLVSGRPTRRTAALDGEDDAGSTDGSDGATGTGEPVAAEIPDGTGQTADEKAADADEAGPADAGDAEPEDATTRSTEDGRDGPAGGLGLAGIAAGAAGIAAGAAGADAAAEGLAGTTGAADAAGPAGSESAEGADEDGTADTVGALDEISPAAEDGFAGDEATAAEVSGADGAEGAASDRAADATADADLADSGTTTAGAEVTDPSGASSSPGQDADAARDDALNGVATTVIPEISDPAETTDESAGPGDDTPREHAEADEADDHAGASPGTEPATADDEAIPDEAPSTTGDAGQTDTVEAAAPEESRGATAEALPGATWLSSLRDEGQETPTTDDDRGAGGSAEQTPPADSGEHATASDADRGHDALTDDTDEVTVRSYGIDDRDTASDATAPEPDAALDRAEASAADTTADASGQHGGSSAGPWSVGPSFAQRLGGARPEAEDGSATEASASVPDAGSSRNEPSAEDVSAAPTPGMEPTDGASDSVAPAATEGTAATSLPADPPAESGADAPAPPAPAATGTALTAAEVAELSRAIGDPLPGDEAAADQPTAGAPPADETQVLTAVGEDAVYAKLGATAPMETVAPDGDAVPLSEVAPVDASPQETTRDQPSEPEPTTQEIAFDSFVQAFEPDEDR